MVSNMIYLKRFVKDIIPYGIVRNKYLTSKIYTSDYPNLYNEFGEKMITMYLNEDKGRHNPYSLTLGRLPRRLLWDRYNHALDLQMYGHKALIFDRQPRKDGVKQFGIMIESESICPEEYKIVYKKTEEIKNLDALFTFSEPLLDKYPNAKFSLANGVWYGTKMHGGYLDAKRYEKKNKLISAVASSKAKSPLHFFRAENARELKRRGLADTMGTAVGHYFEKISDAFDDYMYNIAIENDHKKYYFTEKILDCFASMTIPVYYGATEIGNFFNEEGIIKIKEPTIECIIKTIKQCSEKDYFSRINAVIDNYERVQHYLTVDDYLTDNYMDLFIK